MENKKLVKLGIIGLGQRGHGLIESILLTGDCVITAVCDKYADRILRAQETVKKIAGNEPIGYTTDINLINDKNVDAVFIAASWEAHTDLACMSMKAKKFTAVEVAGAYDIEDCWQLVRTYEETKTPIMMMENCCFDKFELLTTSLQRNGVLGDVLFCHGSYSHELRDEILGGNIDRHYRLNNYRLRNCENYPTHEFGPIAKLLKINQGNKILTLSSVATRQVSLEAAANSSRNRDQSLVNAKFKQGDIVVTTLTTTNGEVITLTLDTTLPRYYSREFQAHCTNGIAIQEANLVMVEQNDNMHEYFQVNETIEHNLNSAKKYYDYLPDCWKNITEEQMSKGHDGIDYIEFKAFFDAVLNNKPMPIDVYDMALWMSITPLSEQSIAQGGALQAVPDFTRGKWVNRSYTDVVEMPVIKNEDKELKNKMGRSRGE